MEWCNSLGYSLEHSHPISRLPLPIHLAASISLRAASGDSNTAAETGDLGNVQAPAFSLAQTWLF